MSLKEEIEKLIQIEQERLAVDEQKFAQQVKDYYDMQRDRFAPLAKVLKEVISSVDSTPIEVFFTDSWASIYIGRSLSWKIEPNYEYRFEAKRGECNHKAKEGFRLEETKYLVGDGMGDGEIQEKERIFDSQEPLLEYVISVLVKEEARQRHFKQMWSDK